MTTIAKKKVEDVMPIATGHEKEELEAELERGGCLTLTFLKVPSEQGAARIGKVILESAILITVVVLSLTVYTLWAAKRGYDFNFLGPFLFGALIMLIVFAMIQITPLILNSMP
ncbi:hypothetical protein Bca52824_000405 [Brassica carinata]|uniref:Uncharacterized protein n=1 Tax=Brassica carinata TaxID=52824 RepID=A0A8X7WHC1_BRACI|nr:hypothetical protein Bca52824_000405 [Brassica carinata]